MSSNIHTNDYLLKHLSWIAGTEDEDVCPWDEEATLFDGSMISTMALKIMAVTPEPEMAIRARLGSSVASGIILGPRASSNLIMSTGDNVTARPIVQKRSSATVLVPRS